MANHLSATVELCVSKLILLRRAVNKTQKSVINIKLDPYKSITTVARMDQHVEHVARAFYDAQDNAKIWDWEPEILKEEFRLYARGAIALFGCRQKTAVLKELASKPASPSTPQGICH
jgi:hypothetical protein